MLHGTGATLYAARMTSDPDAALRASLNRHKLFASALLGLMAALAAGSYALPPSPWTTLLRDATKAGFIGGVADWFAVTALFGVACVIGVFAMLAVLYSFR